MTEKEPQLVGLQLAPSAHVTDAMRAIVAKAFADAGIGVSGWVPLEGEPQPAERETIRIAEPSLAVLVTAPDNRTQDDLLSALAESLGGALATIRGALPELPLGMNVSSVEGTQWLSFRLEDSPDAILRATAALSETFGRGVDSLGWDDAAGLWRGL
jgi:hypothetical protein